MVGVTEKSLLCRDGWLSSLILFSDVDVFASVGQFYYEAIGRALDNAKRDHPGAGIHIVGHSIGGTQRYAKRTRTRTPTRTRTRTPGRQHVYSASNRDNLALRRFDLDVICIRSKIQSITIESTICVCYCVQIVTEWFSDWVRIESN